MRASLSLTLAAALGLSVLPLPARAQSLGDLARQEAERRKALKDPEKVITDKDVPVVAQPQPNPASKPADAAKPADGDKPAADGDKAKTDDKAAPSETRDQKYWADRYHGLTTQLERDHMFAEALQSRINALWTDFVNRDDPAQKALVANDRERALAELDRVHAAIESDEKAITEFEEEARRASVPPGWLR